MTTNCTRKKYILLTYFFIVILFPLFMHIYGALFDLLTYNNFFYLAIMALIFVIVVGIKKPTKEWLIFLPFILTLLVSTLFFNKDNIKDLVKYSVYISIYLFLLVPYYSSRAYYKLYINIICFFITVSILLFMLVSVFPEIGYDYSVEKLSFVSENSSFVTRRDWDYSLPFYLYVHHINTGTEVGILGIERFFGFSTESTMFACIVLPAIFIAYIEQMNISLVILISGLILASSYGSFLFAIIGLVYIVFYKYKKQVTMAFIIIFTIALFLIFQKTFLLESARLITYADLFYNVQMINIEMFSSEHFFNDEDAFKLPTSYLTFLVNYGLLPLMGLIFIVLYIVKKSSLINDRVVFAYTIVYILMLAKASEPLSMLFLFYSNYLNVHLKEGKVVA